MLIIGSDQNFWDTLFLLQSCPGNYNIQDHEFCKTERNDQGVGLGDMPSEVIPQMPDWVSPVVIQDQEAKTVPLAIDERAWEHWRRAHDHDLVLGNRV